MFIRIEILRLISRRNRGDLAILERNAETSEYLALGAMGTTQSGCRTVSKSGMEPPIQWSAV